MFDVDPFERNTRILWYHAESDSYGICNTSSEFNHFNQDGQLDDVTGVKHHEDRYKELMSAPIEKEPGGGE